MEIKEKVVSRAIIETYMQELLDYLETDVAIVGAGPAGLTAAYYLASSGVKTVVFERRLSTGGGMWGGGIMFNHIVVQEEAKPIMEELDIRLKLYKPGYYIADSVEAVSTLTSKAVKAGAKIFNLVSVEDVLLREERVAGLVLNWTAVGMANLHIDPIGIEAKYVIDGTGHDTEVVDTLKKRNKVKLATNSGDIEGEYSMWAEKGEQDTISNTREVYPGLYVTGMSCNAVFGSYRMGAIFGGMLISGKKVADIIKKRLDTEGVKK